MFDFEKLHVFQKAKAFNHSVKRFLRDKGGIDRPTKDQLSRAALSVMINIAEGSERYSLKDKRNFLIYARASLFECVAAFDFLKTEQFITEIQHRQYYSFCEELSKMLYSMIRKLELSS